MWLVSECCGGNRRQRGFKRTRTNRWSVAGGGWGPLTMKVFLPSLNDEIFLLPSVASSIHSISTPELIAVTENEATKHHSHYALSSLPHPPHP
jgi:hypothetical protein